MAAHGTLSVITGFFSNQIIEVVSDVVPQKHVLLVGSGLAYLAIMVVQNIISYLIYVDGRVDESEQVVIKLIGMAKQTVLFVVVGILLRILNDFYSASDIAWYETIASGGLVLLPAFVLAGKFTAPSPVHAHTPISAH